MHKTHLFFHLSFYYIAWFSCVFLAAHEHGWYAVGVVLLTVIAQAIWQVYVVKQTQGLWLMLGVLAFFGAVIDTAFVRLGVITFSANPFGDAFSPPWMISIWVSFAMIFYALLKKMHHQYKILGLLSLVFFPIAYIAGAKMGAAHFPLGYCSSSIIIGITWAICFPLCLIFFNYIER